MNFLKTLLNRVSVSVVPTPKRIVFNLIELSFQKTQQATNKDFQSLKATLQNARKKHLYAVYKKRKRKSSVFLQNFGKIIFKLCRKERKK